MTRRIVLIIGGGIAAYKCLELIRRLRERGYGVRTVMTRAAQAFVTPLSVGALSNERVFTDLFDLDEEREIGHIRLSREAELIVVAPATADLLAKMANGFADDLASAVLLATDKPVLVAPAMNPRMWHHPATRRNMAQLLGDGIHVVGPNAGEMAERGEAGIGRMAEPHQIAAEIERLIAGAPRLESSTQPLAGRHVLVTSGPTHEPIDPVRFISNRSSGKQGHAIAAAAKALGARVTLVTGPVTIPSPAGVDVRPIECAEEMLAAVRSALPADIAVFAAAVADWRVASTSHQKLKKSADRSAPILTLMETTDILKTISCLKSSRPALVIGFAAETQDVLENGARKLTSKGADWIVANDVSEATGTFGGDGNTVHLLTPAGVESWAPMSKSEVAAKLMERASVAIARAEEPTHKT